MDEQAVRDRAAKLQRLADDPAAAPGERAGARGRLTELALRHGDVLAEPAPPAFADRRVYGDKAKETAELNSRALADLIKADIKTARTPAPRDAVAATAVPAPRNPIRDAPRGIRFHVKHSLHTGSPAIDITISSVPIEWATDEQDDNEKRKLSPACEALVDALNVIVSAYNWRGDGFMQDLMDCRFFSRTRVRTTDGETLPI
ncbi:hypothetical protein ACWEO1_16815 [Kitasatospora cineracea]